MSVAALGTLVWRHPLADVAAKAAAPIGAAFTFLALVTGSLWGRPMWGTYWVWDARLTSVLVLFLMYLGLIALWRAVDDPARAARAAAMLTLVGAINMPIIKFSVDWWNTLHQPASVLRLGGPTIDRAFLIPLLVMAIGFSLLFVTLHLAAMRNEILRRRVRSLQMMQAAARVSEEAVRVERRQTMGRRAWVPTPPSSSTAYTLVAVVVVILIGWIAIDYRNQNAAPARARGSGAVRRSGRTRRISDERERHRNRRREARPGCDAAADRFRRSRRAVLVAARRRRSLEDSLRADRPSGAADRAAAARGAARDGAPCRASIRPRSRAR